MRRKKTEISLIGTAIEAQEHMGKYLLGDGRFNSDFIMSWILKKGVLLIISVALIVAIAIVKPYIDSVFDNLFLNISSHDLHLFKSYVLEQSSHHNGRYPISVFMSWATVILMYVVLIAADWRVKFNFNAIIDGRSYRKRDFAHLMSWILFNVVSIVVVMTSFAHFEANKFAGANQDKFTSKNLKYVSLDSTNHSSLLPLKKEVLEIVSQNGQLLKEIEKESESKLIWVKRQGIEKYQNQFGHKGLKRKVTKYESNIKKLKQELKQSRANLANKRRLISNKVTKLHWKDLQLNHDFRSEIKTKKIVGNAKGSLLELSLFALLKLLKQLMKEDIEIKNSNSPRLRITSNIKGVTGSGAKHIGSALKWIATKTKPKPKPVSEPKLNQNQTETKPVEAVETAIDKQLKRDKETYEKFYLKLKGNVTYGKYHDVFISLYKNGEYVTKDPSTGDLASIATTRMIDQISKELILTSPRPVMNYYASKYVNKLKNLENKANGVVELF